MEHKSTPEEQLLKLIENPDAAAKKVSAEGKSLPQAGKAKFSLFAFHLPAFLKGKQAPGTSLAVEEAGPFSYIKRVNVVLIAAAVLCLVYLALDLSVLKGDPRNFLSQVSVQEAVYPVQGHAPNNQGKKEVKHYYDLIERRNPFTLSAVPVEPVEEKPQPLSVTTTQSEKMNKLLQTIKLVGISWSGGNPLAMIEETESGKTYFLKEGQEINGLRVQTVDKEKAVVTYEGEEASLY